MPRSHEDAVAPVAVRSVDRRRGRVRQVVVIRPRPGRQNPPGGACEVVTLTGLVVDDGDEAGRAGAEGSPARRRWRTRPRSADADVRGWRCSDARLTRHRAALVGAVERPGGAVSAATHGVPAGGVDVTRPRGRRVCEVPTPMRAPVAGRQRRRPRGSPCAAAD